MTTLAQLRKAALSLPEVEEGTHLGTVAFKANGKRFASVTKDGTVQLVMTVEDAHDALRKLAAATEWTHSGKRVGVAIPLAAVNGMELNALVEKAWRHRAPKRLVNARLAAARGVVPEGPDALPKSIGRLATRALLAAGITTLGEVARRSDAELLGLHGVGPRAVRLLREAIAKQP